jgi:hypothetical protein
MMGWHFYLDIRSFSMAAQHSEIICDQVVQSTNQWDIHVFTMTGEKCEGHSALGVLRYPRRRAGERIVVPMMRVAVLGP